MTNPFERTPQRALVFTLCALMLSCASRQEPAPAASPTPAPAPVPAQDRPALEDPGQQFVMVVAELVQVVAGHGADCERTLTAATTWIEAHRPELVAIEQRLRVKVMAMDQEQRERYSDQLEELLKELVGDIDEAMNRFEAQCPEHAERVGAQLDFLEIDYL